MADSFAFNLVREPWIPCLAPGGTSAGEFGFRDALAQAHQLQEIYASSPLVTISLYRLLIAVLHSAIGGPRSTDEWGAMWRAGQFDMSHIDRYLEKWEGHFDLFDRVHPFYQRADLEEDYSKSITQIVHELPKDDGELFLDHTNPLAMEALAASEAARALVTAQCFSPGGLVSLRKQEPAQSFKSADGSPIFKSAVTLVRGETLHQTLMLNLCRYSEVDGVPMPAREGDRPAWERVALTAAEDRFPDGYRDLLTWQSRRIRLFPCHKADGTLGVSKVVVMKGNQFPDDFELAVAETMVPFKKDLRKNAKVTGWVPLVIRNNRSLWRDSTAILQQAGREGESAPLALTRSRSFDWLATLETEGELGTNAATLAVEVFGVESDQAKLNSWKHEHLPLPLEYLTAPQLTVGLGYALALAEDVGRLLEWTTSTFAELALASESDEGGRKADRAKGVTPLRESIDVGASYWPFLESPYLELMRGLPGDVEKHETDDVYGKALLAAWSKNVKVIADRAMKLSLGSGGTSGRMLKAAAKAEGVYRAQMAKHMTEYAQRIEGGIAVERAG